ncbi:MAG: hypothetical protein HND47_21175 [Chloroflexi bacterium]|nr:hypothetical protein [Chloroflexota bacterium]
MSSSQELYNRLSETMSALVKVTNRKQLANWLWIVVGLLQGKSPALSQIANFLPMNTQAESRVTLIRRWLMNWHVDVWAFYEPILKHVLQGWSAVQAYVILDGVMIFGDRWQIFRVSLQHGCRAIPLSLGRCAGQGLDDRAAFENDVGAGQAAVAQPCEKRGLPGGSWLPRLRLGAIVPGFRLELCDSSGLQHLHYSGGWSDGAH